MAFAKLRCINRESLGQHLVVFFFLRGGGAFFPFSFINILNNVEHSFIGMMKNINRFHFIQHSLKNLLYTWTVDINIFSYCNISMINIKID